MHEMIKSIDPIEEIDGFLVKRGDLFKLGYVNGSKVRQCFHVVERNLDKIKTQHNGTIITGAGLPSPQTAITAQVAHHFGLDCIISVHRYDNSKVDLDRINVSIAQKLGAKIYGVSNPQSVGPMSDVKWHKENSNPYEIKFGMIGLEALEPVIYQTQNIPETVEEITVISGSGLSALSILMGVKKHGKSSVKQINIIDISGFIYDNKKKWYDPLPIDQKFEGNINIVQSAYPYRTPVKKYELFDYTYEAKAWDWMINNKEPNLKHLFWVVGVKSRDYNIIEPIRWHTSGYQEAIYNKKKTVPFFQ